MLPREPYERTQEILATVEVFSDPELAEQSPTAALMLLPR